MIDEVISLRAVFVFNIALEISSYIKLFISDLLVFMHFGIIIGIKFIYIFFL